MKIRIFDEKKPVVEEKEVWLKLEQYGTDARLIACNSAGKRLIQGNILTIATTGILRTAAFNPDLGFEMEPDSDSKIKIN